jgi:hypothetical protein
MKKTFAGELILFFTIAAAPRYLLDAKVDDYKYWIYVLAVSLAVSIRDIINGVKQ